MKLSDFMNNENEKKDKENSVEKLYDEMKDMSENELLKKLEEEIKGQKVRGEFDYDAIVLTLNSFKNFIREDEYEKMIRILDELKNR